MTRTLISVAAAVVSLVATRALLKAAIPHAPMTKPNYRGVSVAVGMGVLLLAGFGAGLALIGFASSLWHRSAALADPAVATMPLLALAFGFGLLGLFDDISSDTERGFTGHLRALRRATLTGGALKLLGGALIALAIAAPLSPTFGWMLVNAITIALFANLFNAFDLRPGRCIKFFLLGAGPLVFVSPTAGPAAAGAIGAAVAFLREDLAERVMLGDTGSNALGALMGGCVILTGAPDWFRLALLGLLVVLTIVAERPGYSALIEKTPGLSSFDRLGRI